MMPRGSLTGPAILGAVDTAAPPAPAGRPGQRGSIGWWYAGMVLDLVHMPLVIGMVLFGATIWRGDDLPLGGVVVVIVQVATLGCPVMALTGWMKRRYDPDYQQEWSFTHWLYRRYGRLVGVAVFVFFLVLATVVRFCCSDVLVLTSAVGARSIVADAHAVRRRPRGVPRVVRGLGRQGGVAALPRVGARRR